MQRIGLVGYSCRTGLGELNRQLAEYLPLSAWLVKPHPQFGELPLEQKSYLVTHSPREFFDNVDVVIFCERPYYEEVATTEDKKLICVPMQEWMPEKLHEGWPAKVSKWICPTQHCYEQFKDTLPCSHFPWPTDLARFKFKAHTKCNSFLFLNGHGGWKGRKGASVIRTAKSLCPNVPLFVSSQTKSDWPEGIEFIGPFEDNNDLYQKGDVLIAPHSVDGIGLEILEAITCGLSIVSTDGCPWNEYPSIVKIKATKERRRIMREVDWYLPCAVDLANKMQQLLGTDLEDSTWNNYVWSRERAWSPSRVEEFLSLLE